VANVCLENMITRADAGREVIDFGDAVETHTACENGTVAKKSVRGMKRNCRFSGNEMVHLPGKYPGKEEDQRRANSHDVDKLGRWAAARWVPGGSTGVHQGGRRYVRPKGRAE